MALQQKNIVVLFVLIAFILAVPSAFGAKDKNNEPTAQDLEAKAKKDYYDLESRVGKFRGNIKQLQDTFANEISDRDRLMLQQRFVAGKEFYFLLGQYREAAEIFWGIVLHPEAANFPKIADAAYYLAESLFKMGYYFDSQQQYERIVKMGPNGSYFAISLMRLIEISLAQQNYKAAETYYRRLLEDAPPGTDSSLGLYLIGKSHFIRGDATKGFGVLEQIPETANYYGVAQYYMAAYQVRNGQYDDAMNRLRKLKPVFGEENVAHHDDIEALTKLSIGRLAYESNDFPHALSQYFSVSPESQYYPEALYESIWVLSTRNDFLLKAVADEDAGFSSLSNDYSYLDRGLTREEDKDSALPLHSEVSKLEPEISEMTQLLEKIDERLASLQEEAVKAYNELVTSAPGSPDLPEAEMLIGGIYTQVRQYDKAENWYKQAQSKYTKFANKVSNAKTRFSNDQIAISAVEVGSLNQQGRMPDTARMGIPPEVAYWLAADEQVKDVFQLFKQVQLERESIMFMRDMIKKIEQELRTLESGVGFPILKETHRRALALEAEGASLQNQTVSVEAGLALVEDEQEKKDLSVKADELRQQIAQGKAMLKSLATKIEAKKQERIASYREDYRQLAGPIAAYAQQVETLYADAADLTANTARAGLGRIENRLYDLVLQAQTGVVDTAWRSTEGTTDDIKRMQRQMEEQIRQFRKNITGSGTESSGN